MLSGSMLRNLDQEFRLAGRRIIPLSNPERIAGYFRRIGAYLAERDPAKAPEISGSAYRLMAEIAREGHSPRPYPEILDTVIRDMKTGFELRRTVWEIAERHDIEIHTLMRLFRKHLGTSPREYLIRLRMEAAKHLVGSTELSMKEIAGQLGYCNPLYFSTAFRRAFHTTPSRYRKARRTSFVE
ncbi:HTH-type transcriptional activator RhaS [bioreactor metagenome]|uniref:HTH-type transcriptional activator RhaS n=1 Tax=bioreactor metagenome TaxID=1076179 RepID=A0A645GZC1_9ZZZZ